MLPPEPLEIRVAPEVADALALGAIAIAEIDPAKALRLGAVVDAEIAEVIVRLRERAERDPGAYAALYGPARALYKRFGIDPTKHRPSSEQLARRVMRGDAFPRVNPLVDAMNLCQLQERLPYGLYDLDALEPPIVARAGLPGEGYEGIRKGFISVEGRPALFDRRGPFGNPTSDSDRAKTSAATRRALVVIFGSPEMPFADWERLLDRTVETMLLHVPGVVLERRIVLGGGRGA